MTAGSPKDERSCPRLLGAHHGIVYVENHSERRQVTSRGIQFRRFPDVAAPFVFTSTGSDLLLELYGFDVDSDDEIEVVLCGQSLGFFDKESNEALQVDQVVLAAADQLVGDNVLEFH